MNLRIPKSKSSEWCTPQWLFDELDSVYQFTVDGAATAENAKCERFWTKEIDGLKRPWPGGPVFINPPFDKETISGFVERGWWNNRWTTSVLLVPVKSDQPWWMMALRADRFFIRGRVRFEQIPGVPFKNTATQPIVILEFSPTATGMARQWNPKDQSFKRAHWDMQEWKRANGVYSVK